MPPHDLSHITDRRLNKWEMPLLRDVNLVLPFLHSKSRNGTPLGQIIHAARQSHFIIHFVDKHMLGGYDPEEEHRLYHHHWRGTPWNLTAKNAQELNALKDAIRTSDENMRTYVYRLRRLLIHNLRLFKVLNPHTPKDAMDPEWLERRYRENSDLMITARAVETIYEKMLEMLEPVLETEGYPENGKAMVVDYDVLEKS